jgi:beta-phosphoglucomutase
MAEDTGNTARVPKAVIWDMDGVIADTGAAHFAAWRQVMAELGCPFDEADFRRIFGLVNPDAIRLLLGKTVSSHEIARIIERKETLFREAVQVHVSPLPGVETWLERLRQQGYRQAIASSAPRANIEVLLHVLNIGPYFQATVAADDVTRGKPDPSIFLRAAATLGVSPARCVVVEDAIAGVQAARRAGMVCLAVATTQPVERLRDADLVVKRLTELAGDAFEWLLALRWADRGGKKLR